MNREIKGALFDFTSAAIRTLACRNIYRCGDEVDDRSFIDEGHVNFLDPRELEEYLTTLPKERLAPTFCHAFRLAEYYGEKYQRIASEGIPSAADREEFEDLGVALTRGVPDCLRDLLSCYRLLCPELAELCSRDERRDEAHADLPGFEDCFNGYNREAVKTVRCSFEKLAKAGYLSEDFRPTEGRTWAQKACIVAAICYKAKMGKFDTCGNHLTGIEWVPFVEFWGLSPKDKSSLKVAASENKGRPKKGENPLPGVAEIAKALGVSLDHLYF